MAIRPDGTSIVAEGEKDLELWSLVGEAPTEVVGAVETVAQKSPRNMERLKTLCGKAASKAGEFAIQKAIDYVSQSGGIGG